MSKLTLVFKNGNQGTDVSKITSYSLEGLVLDGTFNPADGVCTTKAGAPTKTLKIDTPEGTVVDGTPLFPLILFPQSANNLTLKIKDSENQDYICRLNFGSDGIVAGNNYKFTITVNKTQLTVSTSITNWNTEDLASEAKSDDEDYPEE